MSPFFSHYCHQRYWIIIQLLHHSQLITLRVAISTASADDHTKFQWTSTDKQTAATEQKKKWFNNRNALFAVCSAIHVHCSRRLVYSVSHDTLIPCHSGHACVPVCVCVQCFISASLSIWQIFHSFVKLTFSSVKCQSTIRQLFSVPFFPSFFVCSVSTNFRFCLFVMAGVLRIHRHYIHLLLQFWWCWLLSE